MTDEKIAKREERKRRLADKEEEFIKDEFLAKLEGVGQEAAEKWIRPERHAPRTQNRYSASGDVKALARIIDELIAGRLN